MKPNRLRLIVIVSAIVIVSVVGSLTGWFPVDRAARGITRPLANGFTNLGKRLGNGFGELGKLGSLGDSNQQLASENDQLQQQLSRLNQLEQENQQLRDQLKFNRRAEFKLLGADVVGWQPDSIRQYVRLNRGAKDGVSDGQVVISGSNLVGVIKHVEQDSAELMLITDNDFRALVTNSDGKTSGIVKGQPGGGLTMERIPQGHNLKDGDIIITSGLDGAFPRGLRLGEVERVEPTGESIFQAAHVEPAFDLKQLRVVMVVLQ